MASIKILPHSSMPKTCSQENCSNPVFSKGFCKWHTPKTALSKPQKRIKPFSDKHLEKLAEYKRRRNVFMADNPICMAKLEGCTREATECHHSLGRLGDLLTDVKYFKAVCHNCHVIIENEPLRAKELGLSGTRFIIK